MIQFFIVAWALIMVQIPLNHYLLFTKILPTLRRVHGHADWKVWPLEELAQVDEYISILEKTESRPWFYYYLKTERLRVALFIIVFVLSLLGAGEGDGKTGVIRAESPQALVEAYHRALGQKDCRSCFLCFDPKMRGEYLREMLFVQGMSEDLKLAAIVNKWLKSDPARPDATFPQVREDDRVPDGVLIYEALQKRSNDLAGFVDEFCRQNDARGRGLFPSFGEVKEIQIRGETAVGYWTPPSVIPIGPTLSTPSGKGGDAIQSVAPPHAPPSGEPAGLPIAESDRREPVHFRRIEGNWYFTYPDPPPPLAPAERAKQLRAEVQSLWVTLGCSQTASIIVESQNGVPTSRVVTGKSYCEVRLGVQPFVYTSDKPDLRLVRLSPLQAKRLIDHLAAEGFLCQAVELGKQKIPQRDLSKNCYTLQVSTKSLQLHEDLGWGPGLLKRLEGLRTALDGDGAEAMSALLTTLDDDRKAWEREAAKPLEQKPSHSEPKALR